MAILPVIDLQGTQVVRGVAGQRESYAPLRTCWADSAVPAEVAAGLVREFGFRQMYVADLDAIAGAPPDLSTYAAIGAAGLALWVDSGVSGLQQARSLVAQACVQQVIVALETLPDAARLSELVDELGARVTFSLDLKAGSPLVSCPQWQQASPREIARLALECGVESFIVLDLSAVGVGEGPRTLDLCREIRLLAPQVRLCSGGGVRGPGDVQQFLNAGCDTVLVASSLHDGSINADTVRSFSRLP